MFLSNHVLSASYSILGVIFNLLLMPLILYKSSPLMEPYKYLLFLYTLQSVLQRIFCVFVDPNFSLLAGGILALYIYAAMWIQIVTIIIVCFLQRYWTLTESARRYWFTNKSKIVMMIMISLLITGIVELIMVLGYWPTERKNNIMREDFNKRTGFDIDETPCWSPDIGDNIDWYGVASSGFFAVYATTAGGIIGVIIFRMIQIFRTLLKDVTVHRLEYQTRIFLLLLVQTFFPMIFNFSPAIVVHFGAILKWNLGEGIITFCSLISLAQCIDPIATFFFLKDYRHAVFHYFKKKTGKVVSSTVSETTTDHGLGSTH